MPGWIAPRPENDDPRLTELERKLRERVTELESRHAPGHRLQARVEALRAAIDVENAILTAITAVSDVGEVDNDQHRGDVLALAERFEAWLTRPVESDQPS
jgi:hypothetical protein